MNVYLCRQCHDCFQADTPRGDATEGYLCRTCWTPDPPDAQYERAPTFDGGVTLFRHFLLAWEDGL